VDHRGRQHDEVEAVVAGRRRELAEDLDRVGARREVHTAVAERARCVVIPGEPVGARGVEQEDARVDAWVHAEVARRAQVDLGGCREREREPVLFPGSEVGGDLGASDQRLRLGDGVVGFDLGIALRRKAAGEGQGGEQGVCGVHAIRRMRSRRVGQR